MAASFEDVERWMKEGREKGAEYIISVCDTFDYDDYPVFVMPGENLLVAKSAACTSMQRINEVIDIRPDPFLEDMLPDLTNTESKGETMNAEVARQLTEKNILKDSNVIKKEIDVQILAAIQQKKFSISIKVPPASEKDMLKKHYTDLGFTWKNIPGEEFIKWAPKVELSW